MHENYFEITKESKHYQEWFDYLKADDEQRTAMRAFAKEHGLNIDVYAIWKGNLWVNPEKNAKFAEQFLKETVNGLKGIKKTSEIGKAFKKAQIKRADKPYVPWFFKDCYGKHQVREFDYNGKVYCQFNTENENIETPKGFIRIKASEFYKTLEAKQEEGANNA